LVATAVTTFGLGVAVLQHRIGLLSGALLAGAAQFGAHQAFEALAAAPASHHAPATMAPTGHSDHLMWLAHLSAAVLTLLVWSVRCRLWSVLTRVIAAVGPAPVARIASLTPAPARRVADVLTAGSLRGPPMAAA
jgi:hypothetical protein